MELKLCVTFGISRQMVSYQGSLLLVGDTFFANSYLVDGFGNWSDRGCWVVNETEEDVVYMYMCL